MAKTKQIVDNFDLAYCKILYIGDFILCHKDAIDAIKTGVTKYTMRHVYNMHVRISKALSRGYTIDGDFFEYDPLDSSISNYYEYIDKDYKPYVNEKFNNLYPLFRTKPVLENNKYRRLTLEEFSSIPQRTVSDACMTTIQATHIDIPIISIKTKLDEYYYYYEIILAEETCELLRIGILKTFGIDKIIENNLIIHSYGWCQDPEFRCSNAKHIHISICKFNRTKIEIGIINILSDDYELGSLPLVKSACKV
jgi:hypothetical protein